MKSDFQRIPILTGGLLLLIFFSTGSAAQTKTINTVDQSWISLNSTIRLSQHWGMVADAHIRRTNFMADPNFYFLRTGIHYWLSDHITFTFGIGKMWVAPTTPLWNHFAEENRIYQQAMMVNNVGRISLLQRIRNEQRWIEKIADDQFTGEYKFSNRIRYLLSFGIPLFKDPHYPSISLSDEVMFQFGKEIIFNTFDQNRLFLGLKQPVSKTLSFDLGYMLTYQQKAIGNQYDKINTLRLFFYYAPDLRKGN